nr:MAG TPA: hypothetical protein [Caudoviricetes sp.]
MAPMPAAATLPALASPPFSLEARPFPLLDTSLTPLSYSLVSRLIFANRSNRSMGAASFHGTT